MNQIKFETAKKHCLFVMLPERSEYINFSLKGQQQYLVFDNNGKRDWLEIPDKDWQLQGFVCELTDEQKEGVIPNVDMTGYGKLFPNYLDDEGTLFMDVEPSFETLLTSLNVLLVNPYKFPSTIDHEFYDEPYDGTGFYQELYSGAMEQWQTAQKNVGNYILLTCNK